MSDPEVEGPIVTDFHVTLGRAGRRQPERLAMVVGALLLVAMIKPWGSSPAGATAPPPRLRTVAPTGPAAVPDLTCAASRWLIEADERWAGATARTWVFTDAVEAVGPTDPAITFVTVAAQHVIAIGYCPTWWDDNRPHQRLNIYRLEGPATVVVPIRALHRAQQGEAAANTLYQPLAGGGSTEAAPWPAGHYVMQISGPGSYERWLGFDIRLVSLNALETPAPPTPGLASARPSLPAVTQSLPSAAP